MDVQSSSAREGNPLALWSRWWALRVTGGIDHQAVFDAVSRESGWSAHFAVMTMLSAGIAVLGLLLSSPAVVIGAMLISPLMGPIIALGFGIATFDWREIRHSLGPTVAGVVLAVAFCALIVLASPLQTVTSEISSRTRPNLFDLLVALFSGLAGTYAVIRGRQGAIVGVAIATALMPPLAVMGFGLATADWSVLAGSGLLFFTNLMTISAAAAVLARLYGFAPNLSPHQTRMQAALITAVLVTLAVPLGLSLRQIAWEAVVSRETSTALAAAFPADARVNDVQIDFHAQPIDVAATVITPRYIQSAERELAAKLRTIFARPIALSLEQVRAVSGDGDAEVRSTVTPGERSAARLASQLALVAGVPENDVLIDRVARRAVVRATPLSGADLEAYRTLEQRVAASESGWSVTLVPPALPLPIIEVKDDSPDEAALATAIWAGQRLQLPIGVSAAKDSTASMVVKRLQDAGLQAKQVPEKTGNDQVKLSWLSPDRSESAAPGD